MMRNLGVEMQVECNVETVLDILRKNKAEHADMVKEAKEGYLKAAEAHLKKELLRLKDGQIKGLYVRLDAPKDYTSEYKTVIKMLEMHTDDTITMNANEVRMFIEDKWDWRQDFIGTNSAYSTKTAALVR